MKPGCGVWVVSLCPALHVIAGDLTVMPAHLRMAGFDGVLMNPPFPTQLPYWIDRDEGFRIWLAFWC